jgi:hypothetical protein
MKRLFSTCAVTGIFLLGAALSASAQNLSTTMNGGEETPIVLTGAHGTATVSVDSTNRELTVQLTVFNVPTATTAGHIHVAPRGIAGPVVIDFPNVAGRTGDFTMNLRVGPAQFRARPEIGINTLDDAIQAILGGNAYVNIHTGTNPGGEIRGQLTAR